MFAAVAAVPPTVGTIVSALISDEPPDCVVILDKYDRYIGTDAAKVAILTTPGPDKRSPLEADEEAKRCGIDAGTLADIVKTP
jgi:hypothetical protein